MDEVNGMPDGRIAEILLCNDAILELASSSHNYDDRTRRGWQWLPLIALEAMLWGGVASFAVW